MKDIIFTAEAFIDQLTGICKLEEVDCISLEIDNSNRWPHFRISGHNPRSPAIKGYFVERGTSYWEIDDSGRESYTGDYASSIQFVEDLKAVIHVLATAGCIEKKWNDQKGKLVCSSIEIVTSGRKIVFGKVPSF